MGRRIPDLRVRRAGTPAVSLVAIAQGRPLVLVLIFTRCTGVCSPFLASLASAQQALGDRGGDYHTLVLSFDPRDSEDDVAEMAAGLGLDRTRDWTFAVAEDADVGQFARSIGFSYTWDADRGQFDHPAMLAGLADGKVVRLLVGTRVEPVRLLEVLRELRGEFVPAYPLPGRVLFRCFQYRAETGEFVLDWGFLLLLLPALAAVLGTLGIFAAGGRHRPA